MGCKKITTERLILKSITDSDYNNLINILTNKSVCETYMVPDLKTQELKNKMFNNLKKLSEDNNHFVYGIYLKDELIGIINDVEIVDKEIELGLVINPLCKNQGYATEVLKVAIDELFKIGFTTIKTGVFVENKASARLMEKIGMVKKETKEEVEYKGLIKQCYCFEITK